MAREPIDMTPSAVEDADHRLERMRRQPRRADGRSFSPKPAVRIQRVRIRGRVVSRVVSQR